MTNRIYLQGYHEDREISLDQLCASVGPGWRKLIEELVEDLFELGWNGQILQVKEKFGSLRFYIGEGNTAVWDRIQRAEEDSAKISEYSGKPGKIRTDMGWMKCLDDEEYAKWKEAGNLSFLAS